MSDLTPEQSAAIGTDLGQVLADPMPRDLHDQIADRIEPHTLNMYLKHRDVMECIDVAWLVIRGYLRDHPETVK